MYSPFRLYSAARTLTTRTTEIKTLNTKSNFFILTIRNKTIKKIT